MTDLMPISQVAREYGVEEEQLRYWDKLGILVPRRVGAVRYYDKNDLEKLTYIRRLLAQGFRPSEIRLALLIGSFVEERSISQTKALAALIKNAEHGENIYIPFGLNRYNTVYRRAQRLARRNGRLVEIRKDKEKDGLNVRVLGTIEEAERAVAE